MCTSIILPYPWQVGVCERENGRYSFFVYLGGSLAGIMLSEWGRQTESYHDEQNTVVDFD